MSINSLLVVLISSLTDDFFCLCGFNMIFRNQPPLLPFLSYPYSAMLGCLLPQDTTHLNSPFKSSPFPTSFLKFSLELILVTAARIHSSAAFWSELESEALYKPLSTTLPEAGYNVPEKVLRWHLWDDLSRENPRSHLAFMSLSQCLTHQCPQDVGADEREDICNLR